MKKNWNKIFSCVKFDNSLVKITGLLFSVTVLGLIIACGSTQAHMSGQTDEETIFFGQSADGDVDLITTIEDKTKDSDSMVDSGAADTPKGANDYELGACDEKSIVVHVCGAVNEPGVYDIAAGSRIIDAVIKAGGFRDDASEDALNLAQVLNDGCKIYFPTVTEMETLDVMTDTKGGTVNMQFVSEGNVTDSEDSAQARVNINTASKDKLMTLKGVGASRADAIIAYREEHGAFLAIEDIMNVTGIKEGSYNKIKDNITVN